MYMIKMIMIFWMLIVGIDMEEMNISPTGNPPGWNGTETVSEMSQDNELFWIMQ